ncbi:hypothetical protein VIBNISFn118_1670005 [Vibrio nigripulchritudo SFn118]|nr:hypothetical protein VIBNISFn118_1670005 [Vibrio nigripulchritudo SFn118]
MGFAFCVGKLSLPFFAQRDFQLPYLFRKLLFFLKAHIHSARDALLSILFVVFTDKNTTV